MPITTNEDDEAKREKMKSQVKCLGHQRLYPSKNVGGIIQEEEERVDFERDDRKG